MRKWQKCVLWTKNALIFYGIIQETEEMDDVQKCSDSHTGKKLKRQKMDRNVWNLMCCLKQDVWDIKAVLKC